MNDLAPIPRDTILYDTSKLAVHVNLAYHDHATAPEHCIAVRHARFSDYVYHEEFYIFLTAC